MHSGAAREEPQEMITGDGRAVVVTGASRGIGEACALHLDALGFRVYAGFRSQSDAESLGARGSARLVPVRLDVTSEVDIGTLADRVRGEVGENGLWGLVNNAGIVVAGPLEVIPPEAMRLQFDVNVHGALRVTQLLLPLLRQAGGRVVNVSSVNGRISTPYAGPYSASKFALEALSDALRMELRRWGIGVSVVEPGAVRTPIWDTTRRRTSDMVEQVDDAGRDTYRRLFERIQNVSVPDRAIPPERVAKVVAHALTARRPRTRYRVGWDSRLGVLLAWALPDRVLDKLITGRRRRSTRRRD